MTGRAGIAHEIRNEPAPGGRHGTGEERMQKFAERPDPRAVDDNTFFRYDGDPSLHMKTRWLYGLALSELSIHRPMTVRQMFYRIASFGRVPKTEAGYRKVQRILLKMRRDGIIPYEDIIDHGRTVRRPPTWESLGEVLRAVGRDFRRDLWANQLQYVLVWIEKNALAGVIEPVTSTYDVPLYVGVGYASESYVWQAAQTLKAIEKPITLYYFGDYDASGKDAARDVREKLEGFGVELDFVEAAVTKEQIEKYDLPTRPAKKTDARAKGWGDVAVELDAIEPNDLRALVEKCIQRHMNTWVLEEDLKAQDADRAKARELAAGLLS